MRTIARLSVALAAISTLVATPAAQDPLSQAKGLYDSASYTEALTALNQVPNTADLVEVEKYRALCLLALGRSKEAEQLLQALAMNRPFYTFDDSDASPRLVTLYQDVRRRTLPEASKQIYQRARASFDSGNMADAARQFKEVVTLADSAPQEHAAVMAELKMLAEGFVRLTETVTKAEAAPAPAPGEAETVPMPTAARPAATNVSLSAPAAASASRAVTAAVDPNMTGPANPDMIYDASDPNVRPPLAVSRVVPSWTRPLSLRHLSFYGTVEVIVGEQGTVVAATIAKPIHNAYDEILVNAAKRWRFQPANAGGRPVKYRLTYGIVVEAAIP